VTPTDNAKIDTPGNRIAKLPIAAAIVALLGLSDAIYLTVHHYTAVPVPCSITEGCEQVLTSQYAEIGGFPLAGFGAVAYFLAFCLALLTVFGDRRMWNLFGIQVTLMAIFTGWLIYLQAMVIEAFCQFCLISAATTFTLFLIFLISLFIKRSAPAEPSV
jgi:uncharacterized membrane protein